MAKQLLTPQLWNKIEPLLPAPKKRRLRYPGRKPISHRQALTGILFVLKTGIPWEYLPKEMGCGSGMTCWRRLRDWHRAGVWRKLHELLLSELQHADQIDWSRAIVDSSSVRAPSGGQKTGPNPVDRRKLGVKHHVIVDGHGIPLALILTAANRHDVTQLLPLIEAIPQIRGKVGKPRHRPKSLFGDRAYDSEPHRKALKKNRYQAPARETSH
jgi:transposase